MNEINKEFSFVLKTNMKFGPGISKNLGNLLSDQGYKRIGLIIDAGVYENDIIKEVIENIKNTSDALKIFKNTVSEPDYDFLESCKNEFLTEEFDCIVGIGGGSTMDTAKGVAVLLKNPGKAISYRGFGKIKEKGLPIIAIPTTAGTGSEVTPYAVFIDKAENKKLGINTEYNTPTLAILDPMLTLSCPKSVTVGSGMDALVHTIESFVARDSTPMSKMFSLKAFSLIFNSLYHITDDLNNIELRSKLLLGSYLAGAALMNSGAGPAGAMSYPLGVIYKVPHGPAGAVFLSKVVNVNIQKGCELYAPLYDLIGNSDKNLTIKEKNVQFGKMMNDLNLKLGIPSSLRVFGVSEADIDMLTNETFKGLSAAIGQNPIPFSEADIRAIFNSMI
jgi:alcohol dehydrogenase class IV